MTDQDLELQILRRKVSMLEAENKELKEECEMHKLLRSLEMSECSMRRRQIEALMEGMEC